MNLEERAEYATQLKKRYNCCQAVLLALADQTNADPELLRQLGSGFGAGMGSMEATCGALVGAGMIAGLHVNGQGAVRYTKQISDLFEEKCGATHCKDLKGRDTGKVLCPCDECVRNAVLAYGEMMNLK